MEISNLFTLIGVVITVTAHLVIVSSKISKHMGTTEECIRSINRRVDEMQTTHNNCHLKRRMEIAEDKQDKLRDEWPERLARIEQDLQEVKHKVEEIKKEMTHHYNRVGKHERASD